jgi:hypothetical protein
MTCESAHGNKVALAMLQVPVITFETLFCAGSLANGLRYTLLPNKLPPNRFYANLCVFAGR